VLEGRYIYRSLKQYRKVKLKEISSNHGWSLENSSEMEGILK